MSTLAREAAVAFAIVLGLVGAASSESVPGPGQDPLAGSRVFGAKGCAACHAVNGVGPKIGPDLGRRPRPRSFYDLGSAMWNHLPRMVERMQQQDIARPTLDAQETANLIAFLYTLNYFDGPGNADAGRRYFAEKRCVVCHQVAGTGGVVGPNLDFLKTVGTPIFVAAAVWNHGPQMTEAMRERGIERPSLIGPELQDLIAFLAPAPGTLPDGPVYAMPGRAESGRRLFTEKRCVSCHAIGEPGGRLGPDLVERGVRRTLIEFAASMWNKAPAMTAAMKSRGISVPQLRPEEMADVVAYLYSVRYFADSGNTGQGRLVARDKGCLRCHSATAGRGRIAHELAGAKRLESPAAVIAALWNHPMPATDARRKGSWPEITPEEMADVAALLQSVGWPR